MVLRSALCYNNQMELLATIITYLVLLAALTFSAALFATIISNIMAKVPFVPSNKRVIRHIAKLADIQKDEHVYDLGAGDGRFLFEAEKYTSKPVIGFENALLPYAITKIKNFFRKANIRIHMKNFMRADFSNADLIYCYLGPDVMPAIAEKIQQDCRKGTRILSHTFSIKTMKPEKVWKKDKKKKLPSIYLYKI